MFKPDDADELNDDVVDDDKPSIQARLKDAPWRLIGAIISATAVVVTLIGFGMQLGSNGETTTGGTSSTTDTTEVAPPTTDEETTTTTEETTTTPPSSAPPPSDPPPASATFVDADEVLTLGASDDIPTQTTSLEAGPLVQAELVDGSTAQPAEVVNLYVQVYGPDQQECQWASAQAGEAGILGMGSDSSRHFLFVVEAIRNDEIDVHVYDIRGELGIDEPPDSRGCRVLGVLGRDTPIPDWLAPSLASSLTERATVNDNAGLDEVLEAATTACATYGEGDHGATIEILGFEHEVVWAPSHAAARDRDENERGGFTAAVTGDGPFLIIGSEGGDDLTSHTAGDVICGNGGDDVITGKEGDDLMIGGPGSDRLRATSGLNILVGDDDDSELTGGTDEDWCSDVEATSGSCENLL